MVKRIVICCDGTGNELNRTMSNVLKFFRILDKNTEQQVFYTPGVGTVGLNNPWQRFKQQCRMLLGLGAGYGLDNDVLKAYDFLCQNWHKGDKIYLFGFSRGAYTVRVLAALVNTIGIIPPEQRNLAEYGLTAYKKASDDHAAQKPGNDLQDAWLLVVLRGPTRQNRIYRRMGYGLFRDSSSPRSPGCREYKRFASHEQIRR